MSYSRSSLNINCNAKDYLPFNKLKDFQGTLKLRDASDYEKIENSFEKHGFASPFFVWKENDNNWVLDGHGRLQTLKIMEKRGITIPELPVVYVNCKDRKDAKKLLLKLNSNFGKMTKESVIKFIDGDLNLDLSSYALPSDNLAIFNRISEDDFKIPSNFGFVPPEENPMFKFVDIKDDENKINSQHLPTNRSYPDCYFRYMKIRFCTTQEEYKLFKDAYASYVKANNTDKGFIYAVLNS